MIFSTFQHISGIGEKTEKQMWEAGIHTWDDFTEENTKTCSPAKIKNINSKLDESKKQIALNKSHEYFSQALPARLHWRMFPYFRKSACYIDIETTGLVRDFDRITTIALYDGEKTYWYVDGENLEEFTEDIKKYKMIITYNGKSFDVPMIENYFQITLDQAHIDLKYVLNSLGYKGGLKKCEVAMGLDRGDLADLDGYCAVILWKEYIKSGDPKVLETLLAYNIEDVINLEILMIHAFNEKIKNTPFESLLQIDLPKSPAVNPFTPDIRVVEQVKTASRLYY